MGDLSEHFDRSEFVCSCGCGFGSAPGEINHRLLAALEVLREILNGPIRITSGLRCHIKNRAVGGVSNSQHMRGTAADIQVTGVAPDRVQDEAERLLPDGGVGRYRTFTHVDVRGHRARWDRRS